MRGPIVVTKCGDPWVQAVADGVAGTPVPADVEEVVRVAFYDPTYDPLYKCGAHPLFCNNGDSYVDLPGVMDTVLHCNFV